MKSCILFLCFVVCAVASIFDDWRPPTSSDVRSPCPGLNALANHGILPRDGRKLTIPLLVAKLGEAVNASAEPVTILALAGLSTSDDPASGAFDLDDLGKHNLIEHDASLSRKDYDLGGEAQTFDAETFAETLSYFNGATDITIKDVAAARWGRHLSSRANNPKYSMNSVRQFASYLESAIYHELLRDPKTLTAPVEWIKIFFSEERFPYNEGWRPINRLTGISIAMDTMKIALNTPGEVPAELLGDALGGFHGGFSFKEKSDEFKLVQIQGGH